jgi:hypothetical protein
LSYKIPFVCVLVVFCSTNQEVFGQAPVPPKAVIVPPNTSTGVLTATGAAGTADITTTVNTAPTVNSVLNLYYYKWVPAAGGNPGAWQYDIVSTTMNLPPGNHNTPFTPTLKAGSSGKQFYCRIDLVQGGVIVNTVNTNAVVAP